MIRRRGVVMVLAGMLVATMMVPAAAAPPQTVQVWIVTLEDDHPSTQHAGTLVQRSGGTLRQVYSHALNGFSFSGSEQAARELERSPRVVLVEADQPVRATDHVTPSGVERIEAPRAHAEGYDGQGVKIAILDTGIDSSHPALDVDVDAGVNCIDAVSTSTEDANSHGTHVAGTASASLDAFVGAAASAQVVPVKVLADSGSGSWESVICGIDHVTADQSIGVANMSLSGSGTAGDGCATGTASALRRAICNSVDEGNVYTVAAGNGAADVANSVPAAYPEVITVSALDEQRCIRYVGGGPARTECGEGLASFSNYGSGIDVTAPGVAIYSTLPGGGYGTKSGTSMAAPHVAGVAALMRFVDPELAPNQLRGLLQSTGECPDGAENGDSGACTSHQGQWFADPDGIAEPLINAPRAAAAAGEAPPVTDPEPEPDPEPDYDDPTDDFGLEVTAYKERGLQKADLVWTYSEDTSLDVFRNDVLVSDKDEPVDGTEYTDHIDLRGGGTYTYRVCEAGNEQVCSAEVTVSF